MRNVMRMIRAERGSLAEPSVYERTLMGLAGHSNMVTTQRYIGLRPATLRAAAMPI